MEDPDTAAAPAESNAAAKSEGQLLLERMLMQLTRYNAVRRRLEKLREQIAPGGGKPAPAEAGTASSAPPASTFFGALERLAAGNDQIAGELEAVLGDLERLF